ncbi:hypothetical protein F4604DRAFT_1688384 [Suillus subluteus]|nr:hypothetical protein F4604DRAFT_1688384 [Suillus subluteus]
MYMVKTLIHDPMCSRGRKPFWLDAGLEEAWPEVWVGGGGVFTREAQDTYSSSYMSSTTSLLCAAMSQATMYMQDNNDPIDPTRLDSMDGNNSLNENTVSIFNQTGIFVSACRHGIVQTLVEMCKSGELYAINIPYAIFKVHASNHKQDSRSYFHWLQFIKLHFDQWDLDKYSELSRFIYNNYKQALHIIISGSYMVFVIVLTLVTEFAKQKAAALAFLVSSQLPQTETQALEGTSTPAAHHMERFSWLDLAKLVNTQVSQVISLMHDMFTSQVVHPILRKVFKKWNNPVRTKHATREHQNGWKVPSRYW